MDGMNDDLLIEILSRAPVKSVCTFRCVSKAWCSLISGREFMEVYRARTQPILIDVGAGSQVNPIDGCDLRLIDMDGSVLRVFKGLFGRGTMCTSMDDLICVNGGISVGVHVVDPATGKVLMRCKWVELKDHHVEPHIRTHIYTTFGFGRAAESGAYKIIRLLVDGRTCEVLTIGDSTTAGWRPTDSVPTNILEPARENPVAINGVLHFLASDDPSRVCLVCFDLDSEQRKKKMIQGPEDGKVSHRRTIRITDLNGAICMVKAMDPYTEIWLLIDSDKSVWRKMHTIPKNQCAPLRILPDGEKILLHSTICHEGRLGLQIYDTRSTICKDVDEVPRGIKGLCSSASLLSTKV